MHSPSEPPLKEQRLTWKSKYEHINAVHVSNGLEDSNSRDGTEDGIQVQVNNGDMKKSDVENGDVGKKKNVLVGLSGYLSSSDEEDSSDSEDSDLNSEVDAFLKEVDNIYGERRQSLPNKPPTPVPESKVSENQTPAIGSQPEQPKGPSAPTVAWQECYDSSTGYTYYWNVETNEVTWDMPMEYQMYLEAMKQWQQLQAQAEVAALLERARNQKLQQQQQQQLQQQQLLIQQAQEAAAAAKQAEQLKAAKRAKTKRKRNRRMSLKKSDSEDDEKIELITSYGPNSGDESESDHEPPPTAAPPTPLIEAKLSADMRRKKKLQKMIKDTAKRNSTDIQMMGPQLHSSRLPTVENNPLGNSLVPYRDADSDPEEKEESLSSTLLALMSKQEENSQVETKKDSPREEDDESTLLDRLRSQTQVLQELGGEIPEEIKSIIVHQDGSDKCPVVSSYSEDSDDEVDTETSSLLKKKIKANKPLKAAKPAKVTENADGQQLYEPEEVLSPSSRADSPEPTAESLPAAKRKFKLEIPVNPKVESLLLPASGKDDLKGLGFTSSEPSLKKTKTEKIVFVKAETLQFQESDTRASAKEAYPGSPNEPSIDIKDVSGVLLDKMRFLAAAKDPVSPVQIWAIQLESLLAAWESENLKTGYFENWLTSITKELETLESTVAPEGWRCEWQRSEKCYSYRNIQTQLIVWEYPQREDKPSCGGEEDMEVCTTPPPPPSPPRISVPSPPPPPAITPPPLPPTPSTTSSAPIPQNLPPLPPLPPMPPPPPQLPPTPPPPPPDDPPPPPPPDVHVSEPLPPGVDPPDVRAPVVVPAVAPVITPPLPPQSTDYMHMHHVPMHHGMAMPVMPHQIHYPMPYPAVAMIPSTISAIPQARAPEMHNLSTELDSFYSDIASMEPETSAPQPPPPQKEPSPPPPPPPVSPPAAPLEPSSNKKKKKTKLAPGLALKKKGVSSLVAKWQQVQEDVRRDMKQIED